MHDGDHAEWRPGWKVLSGRRSPCIVGIAERHYPPGEIVRPARACGPLAIFADAQQGNCCDTAHEQARQWVDEIYQEQDGITIVRCAYVPSTHTSLWCPRQADAEQVAACQRSTIGKFQIYPLAWCPPGTQFADAVCCWE